MSSLEIYINDSMSCLSFYCDAQGLCRAQTTKIVLMTREVVAVEQFAMCWIMI